MLDEEGIHRNPVPRVDALAESRFGLLGGAGADDPEPVRDSVDMRVDGDRRDSVAKHEHAVRRLRTDARQGDQLLKVSRDVSAESVEDLLRHGSEDASLHPVESRGPDQRFDL